MQDITIRERLHNLEAREDRKERAITALRMAVAKVLEAAAQAEEAGRPMRLQARALLEQVTEEPES